MGTEVQDTTRTINIDNSTHNASDFVKLQKSFASQEQMYTQNTKYIAGETGTQVFRDATYKVVDYGGKVTEWIKMKSYTYVSSDGTRFQTHWVENVRTGDRVEELIANLRKLLK